MWSMTTLACCKKFDNPEINEAIKDYFVKRNDDGENIVFTSLKRSFDLSYDEEIYKTFGELDIAFGPRDLYPMSVWLYNSYYDNRKANFGQVSMQTYTHLYDYIMGRMTNVEPIAQIDSFMKEKQNTHINMIVSTISMDDLLAIFPPVTDELKALNHELSEKVYNITKSCYPPHMQDLCYALHKNSISSHNMITRIIEQLLKRGLLKPLNDAQKDNVNSIMFLK